MDTLAISSGSKSDNLAALVSGMPGHGNEPWDPHDTNTSGLPLPKGIMCELCPGNFMFCTVEREVGTTNVAGS